MTRYEYTNKRKKTMHRAANHQLRSHRSARTGLLTMQLIGQMKVLSGRGPEVKALHIGTEITPVRPSSDFMLLVWHEVAWRSATIATHNQGTFAIERRRSPSILTSLKVDYDMNFRRRRIKKDMALNLHWIQGVQGRCMHLGLFKGYSTAGVD